MAARVKKKKTIHKRTQRSWLIHCHLHGKKILYSGSATIELNDNPWPEIEKKKSHTKASVMMLSIATTVIFSNMTSIHVFINKNRLRLHPARPHPDTWSPYSVVTRLGRDFSWDVTESSLKLNPHCWRGWYHAVTPDHCYFWGCWPAYFGTACHSAWWISAHHTASCFRKVHCQGNAHEAASDENSRTNNLYEMMAS